MDSRSVIPWSDLPKELVERIGKFLDTHIDVLRLRAVCTTWRSTLPPFKNSPLPLKLQVPIIPYDTGPYSCSPGFEFYLIESTVYLFQPLDGASVDASSCTGWLVKVIKQVDGKLSLVNPLNDWRIECLEDHMPKVLNLLDFRVSQVSKSYHVQYFHPSKPWYSNFNYGHLVRKILLSTNHVWNGTNHFSLMAIHVGGQLCYLKSGDEKWTIIKNASCNIVDIIVYKGNFYAVDRYGETIKFDSSLIETKVASRLYDGGRKKRLVESSGQLFLIAMFLDVDKEVRGPGPSWNNVLEIKMYRLDEEQHEWIEVYTLGDRIFFAGDDCCFSLSSKYFGKCKGNCIYYVNGNISVDILGEFTHLYDEDSEDDAPCACCGDFNADPIYGGGVISCTISDDGKNEHDSNGNKNARGSKSGVLSEELVARYKGLHGHTAGVFTIEDGKFGSLLSFLEYADIFWPPPSWINGEDQAPSNAQEVDES